MGESERAVLSAFSQSSLLRLLSEAQNLLKRAISGEQRRVANHGCGNGGFLKMPFRVKKDVERCSARRAESFSMFG